MVIASQDERGPAVGALLPRYRRVLAFGDVLDESVRVFRQHWVNFALVSAIALFPPGFLLIWVSASGFISRPEAVADLASGNFATSASLATFGGAILASTLVSVLFGLLWSGAIVTTADAYLRGAEPTLGRVYGRAARRLLAILFATVLLLLVLTVLTVAAGLLFFITVGGLSGLAPLVALIVWWLRADLRKTWLKWVIIVTVPFGLTIYYSFRWSMYVAAAVLEDCGPITALRRSSQLTGGQWFRVASILVLASLIVGIMRSVLTALVEVPLAISSAMRGQVGLSPAESAISSGVGVLFQILFASVGSIVYTLLFVDLRNRREGTDMAERLTQLEASPTTPGG
jgi:hypothetical protein